MEIGNPPLPSTSRVDVPDYPPLDDEGIHDKRDEEVLPIEAA